MSIEKITEILRMCELFRELSDNELGSIAKLGRIEKFEVGEKIYEQSSIETKLYILFKGYVALCQGRSANGDLSSIFKR